MKSMTYRSQPGSAKVRNLFTSRKEAQKAPNASPPRMGLPFVLLALFCCYSSLPFSAAAATDDLGPFSDEFDDPATLSQWSRVYQAEGWGFDQLEQWDIDQSNAGRMTMMPHTSSWYEEWRGVQAYKPIDGDFVVTTDVQPTGRSGSGAPNAQYSLAGIMVRTPRPMTNGQADWTPGGQNYIFLSTGAASNPGTFQFEVKDTRNSVSQLSITAGAPSAKIQVARIGSVFLVLRQIAGSSWEVHRRYIRADMPDTVNVGLTCYTDWNTCFNVGYAFHNQNLLTNGRPLPGGGTLSSANPDLIARFDYVRFRRPQIPAPFAGRDFSNPAEVSNAEILSFLGANTDVPYTAPGPIAPTITQQPQARTVTELDDVSFTVAASGTPPLSYQWRKNGEDLVGETGAVLTLTSVQTSDAGNYSVVVFGGGAAVPSAAATLTVNALVPPTILSQPLSQTVNIGQTATLTATATGTPELSFRWQKDGADVPVALGSTLTITPATPRDAGAYTVIVSNAGGSVTSAVANLTVNIPAPTPAPVAGLNELATITVGTQVLAPDPQRFGLNLVGHHSEMNNFTRSPGMEPITTRMRGYATGGGADFILNDGGATTSYFETITNGFFNGAAVRVYRTVGAELQLVRTNVVTEYYASQTEGYRIELDAGGPAIQADDIYFLDLVTVNSRRDLTHDRIRPSSVWRPVGGAAYPFDQPVEMTYDNATSAPEDGGVSSLRLSTAGSHEVSIRQPAFAGSQFYGGFYPTLKPGHLYRVEAWLRQEGVGTGAAQFRMNQYYTGVQADWTGIDGTWRKFSHTFAGPPEPTGPGISEVILAFNGPGALWIDNFVVYDVEDEPLAMRSWAREEIIDFQPGDLRIWSGHANTHWGLTLDDMTQPDILGKRQWNENSGEVEPENHLALPTTLPLCRDAGARPWLIVSPSFNEAEWLGLIEYLAGPDESFYGARRASQGQTAPWTDEFDRIRIEMGNEMWNYSFDPWLLDGPTHGRFAEYFFQVAKSSPHWPAVAGKIDFIVNGWITNPGPSGYGGAAIQLAPSASFTDVAVYNGGWEVGFLAGGSEVNDVGFQHTLLFPHGFMKYFVDQHVATRDALNAQGVNYNLAVYEGGPGYGLPGPGQEFNPIGEAFGKSLAGGISTLDTYLYNSSRRVDPQAFFHFGAGYNWASHAREGVGHLPHTSWLALKLRNKHASGPMVESYLNSVPAANIPAIPPDGSIAPAVSNAPLIVSHAFRDGDRYSVILISRDVNNATPINLRLPFNSATSATLHTLAGDPRTNNAVSMQISLQQQTLENVSKNMELLLPPGSIYLAVFEGTTTLVPDNPGVTISRAFGQTDATSRAGVRFHVFFDRPVTGLTAEDVIVQSTAGEISVEVRALSPADGMRFEVVLTGLIQDGSVSIDIAPGAATDANAQPNLAPVIIDNDVDFAWPLPTNRLYAHDDFDFVPTSTPHILQGVDSGFGWANGWVAHNYNPATYLDGYKLGQSGSLNYSSLQSAGLHAVGGRPFELCERILDADAFGHVTVFESDPPQIGQTGTELWMSALLRKDTDDQAPVMFYLVNGAFFSGYSRIDVGVGFFGNDSTVNGVRYWTLALRNAADDGTRLVVSDVPVVVGETALLALHLDFGDTDTIRLYANPSMLGGAPPAAPNAEFTTAGATDIRFRSVRFFTGLGYGHWTGDGHDQASMDEIRFGDSFAAVTPGTGPTAGSIRFDSLNYAATETAGSATVTVSRVGGTDGAISVDYEASPSAKSNAATGMLHWANGDGADKSFQVTIANDAIHTGDATVQLTLSNPVAGASLLTPSTATLTILEDDPAAIPPSITTHPQNRNVFVGQSVILTVVAEGTAPFSYEWRKNGDVIEGAAGPTLAIDNAQTTDAGSYVVRVSNAASTAPSNPAIVAVARLTPSLAWNAPAPIVYGVSLSAIQLNASGNVPGAYVYNPPTGTTLTAGGGQSLSVSFFPTDSATYNTVTATVLIDVAKATPSLAWPQPDPITFGTPLTETQLSATPNTPGTFTFDPPAGAVLNAGDQPLSARFQPNDSHNYTAAEADRILTVAKAPLNIKANDAERPFGAPNPVFSAVYSGFRNGDSIGSLDQTATFSSPATQDSAPGTYPILAAGAAGRNYDVIHVSGLLTVTPNSPPQISFINPASGTRFRSGRAVTIDVNASDADGSVSHVQFFSGEQLLAESSVAPFSFEWPHPNPGAHTVVAVATDNLGAQTSSEEIRVIVHPGMRPPRAMPGGGVEISFHGPVGVRFALQRSNNLRAWTTIVEIVAGLNEEPLVDTELLAGSKARFYRVVQMP